MSKDFASLIIPTFNRPKYLLHALYSLQIQTGDNFEIIVVDNAADPKIAALIKNFNQKAKIPAKYFPEPKLGFHNALHLGARKSKGDLLIFTNDDVTFDKNFVRSYLNSFVKNENMAAAGGPIKLKFKSPPPKWLNDLMYKSKVFPPFSYMELYKNFTLSSKGFFFETNMAIRHDIFFSLGGFNPDLFGNIRLGDGDTGLNRKIWQKKLLVGYVPEAIIYHQIPKERMTEKYLIERFQNEGSSDMYTLLQNYSEYQKLTRLPIFIFLMIKLNLKYWFIYLFIKGRPNVLPLKIRLQKTRTISQLKYLKRYMTDKSFQEFVNRKNWLNI